MIKIRSGQTLHYSSGGATDEGYWWVGHEWEFDGETLWTRWSTEGRDCDGRITRSGESWCRAHEAQAGYHFDEVRYPLWHEGEVAQRDYAAEAAGY